MRLPSIGFNLGTVAIGAAAVLLGPAVLSLAGSALKSLTKVGIKSGLLLYDGSKKIALSTVKAVSDVASEAKSEVEEELDAKHAA